MTDSPGLRDLELLHRRLEELRHRIGSSVDYLDRGRPSPEQERATVAAMKVAEETAAALDQELDEAKTVVEGKASDDYDEGFAKTALFVANREVEQWEEVRSGGRYHVIGNRYFLRNRDRIARKHFGF